jgi:hypothetical protein
LFPFCIFRNKDTDSFRADVIEEVDDEASTKKKKGKKEKKKKKDYEDDAAEDSSKELDDAIIEERKKDKKQSKVSGMFVCARVPPPPHPHIGRLELLYCIVFRVEFLVTCSLNIFVCNQKTAQHNVASIFSSENGGNMFL